MVDREKVVRAVKTCFDSWIDKHRNMGLDLHEVERMKRDALELLKEQEPVLFKVTRQDKSYPFWDSVCTGCGYRTSTVKNYWKYCPVCGRKVKWGE